MTPTLVHELLVAFLLLAGSGFMLLAAVGVLRLPDLYLRLSATTKSATLGVTSLLAGAAVGFADWGVAFTALLVAAFFLLTAPVAAHMIGRAAYFAGVPLWEGTRHDELRRDGDARPDRSADTAAGVVAAPFLVATEGDGGGDDEGRVTRDADAGNQDSRDADSEDADSSREDTEPAGAALTVGGQTKGDLP